MSRNYKWTPEGLEKRRAANLARSMSVPMRQFLEVRTRKTDGCWLWTGNVAKNGYGRIGRVYRGPQSYAHRVAFEIFVGPIPAGMLVRHKCDNPVCVRPDHLEVGTIADNNHDMVARGQMPRGEARGHAKLDAEKVKAIRLALGNKESSCSIARRFGVSQSAISKILTGKTWGHV